MLNGRVWIQLGNLTFFVAASQISSQAASQISSQAAASRLIFGQFDVLRGQN